MCGSNQNECQNSASDTCDLNFVTYFNVMRSFNYFCESSRKQQTRKRPDPAIFINKKIPIEVQDAIRVLIHETWTKKGLGPTVNDIRQEVLKEFPNAEDVPYRSNESFRRLLRAMGFRHRRHQREWILFEQQAIAAKRAEFLRRKKELDDSRANGVPIKYYWLDETWLDENHHLEKRWTDMNLVNNPQEANRLGKPILNFTYYCNSVYDTFWVLSNCFYIIVNQIIVF